MARTVELSNAIDAALAALDEDDFEGYSSQSLSTSDDFECQLQMKVQVFLPPPVEDDGDSSSGESTAASETQSIRSTQSMTSKLRSKAGALASSAMPRLRTA